MTSGQRRNPETITCERCGKTAQWKGGRKRRYCSPTCANGSRYKAKLRFTKFADGPMNREREIRQRQLARQAKIDRGNCADCGMEINERTVICIDFDHKNPADKSFTISYEVGRVSDEALITEIAKCDAVCRNCHAYRTHDNQHHLRPGNDNPIRQPDIQTSPQLAFEF